MRVSASVLICCGVLAAPMLAQAPPSRAASPDSSSSSRWTCPTKARPKCPGDHELTYADAIAFTAERTYATMPGLNWGLPWESHTDLEADKPEPKNLRLMYEASLSPLFLFNGKTKPFAVGIIPKVVLRQFAGGSEPVDAPSYMPRVILYYWKPFVDSAGKPKTDPDSCPRSFPYFWLMASHHSNGQEGNPVNADGTPNYYTGNFSTNFLQLGYSEPTILPNGEPMDERWALDWYLPAPLTDPHQRLQGNWRLHVMSTLENAFLRGDADVAWILGPLPPSQHGWRRHINISYTYAHPLEHFAWFDFFFNWYNGQDYYNMRYDRRITLIRLGGELNTLTFRFN